MKYTACIMIPTEVRFECAEDVRSQMARDLAAAYPKVGGIRGKVMYVEPFKESNQPDPDLPEAA